MKNQASFSLKNNEKIFNKFRDQATGLNEGEVFLISGRSFCPLSILYILYIKTSPSVQTGRSLILQGDYFSLVSL